MSPLTKTFMTKILSPRILMKVTRMNYFPKTGQIIQAIVDSLDDKGRGQVHLRWPDSKTMLDSLVVIQGSLPGESVQLRVASIIKKQGRTTKKKQLRAILEVFNYKERIVERPLEPLSSSVRFVSSLDPSLLPTTYKASSFEIATSRCPHFDKRDDEKSCAKCPLIHMKYNQQLIEKLNAYKHLQFNHTVEITPSDQVTRFLKTFEVEIMWNGRDSPPVLGQWSRKQQVPGERNVAISTPRCILPGKRISSVINSIRTFLTDFHVIPAYDSRWNTGILRSVIVHHATTTDQILVNFVSSAAPSKISDTIIRKMKQLADSLTHSDQANSVLLNFSRSRCKDDFLLGLPENELLLSGSRYITERTTAGNISMGGSNKPSLLCLPRNVIDFIVSEVTHEGVDLCIWDCWAGNGFFSVYLSMYGNVKSIISLEGFIPKLQEMKMNLSLIGKSLAILHADIRNPQTIKKLNKAVMNFTSTEHTTKKFSLSSSSFYHRIETIKIEKITEEHKKHEFELINENTGDFESFADEQKAVGLRSQENESIVETHRHNDVDMGNYKLPPPDVLLVAYPPNPIKKSEGLLTKDFRRWIRFVSCRKIVLTINNVNIGKKDIGHLKLLGYKVRSMKIFDIAPHSMESVGVAVLTLE